MTTTPLERLSTALSDRYRLEREVGAGGMATVYLAEDLRHHRRVALKVLKPEVSGVLGGERFLKEIEVTANLQHPHILPLFDSGEVPAADGHQSFLYYVMPFVEGESLRARLDREKQLPLDTAIDLTRQAASALDYAHRQGVIHRDIKPENILLHEGQVLLADFGIALAVRQAGGERLTATGMSIGTPHYMSPEQATSEREIDARSDEYSLACVLYEMIAGEPPFSGNSVQVILSRKMTGSVLSLHTVRDTVSTNLDRVITKALARVPADRYPTMARFSDALVQGAGKDRLPWLSWRPAARITTVLVAAAAVMAIVWFTNRDRMASLFTRPPRFTRVAMLSLENRTADSTQNYIVDGLTESLIADLARLERVDVISLASVLGYRTAPKPADSIARELGVEAVISGSVSRSKGQLVVDMQIIAPGRGAPVTVTVERPVQQVAALEQDVARALVREIGGRLAGPRRSSDSAGSPNAAVHDLYLRGRYHLATRTPEGLRNSLDYFRQVLARDPAHAGAYAGLAMYYSLIPFYTNTPAAEPFALAKTSALKAVELDPYSPEAHGALAYVLAYNDWDWTGAEREYRRALALQPSGADLHHSLSRLLAARGRIPEAVAEAQRSHLLDPLSLVAHANIGIIAYFGRDYAEARRRLTATLQLEPNFSTAHWGLGMVHEQLGEYKDAVAEFDKAIAIDGRGANVLSSLSHVEAMSGHKAEAEKLFKEVMARGQVGPVRPYLEAIMLVGLGRNDEALTMLEKSFDERSAMLSYLDRDPRFDPLHASPRFKELLRKLNLAS